MAPSLAPAARVCEKVLVNDIAAPGERAIDVFLADDNLIVREGVRALIERHADLRVVGVAADYDEVISGATATEPQVLVTDIRMPPSFHREGIDAAKEVRKRHPGTGVVVLSQYDDPEYAVSLLAEGSAGYGYLLKDRVAEGNQLVDAIRSVATGGTALDPAIVEALVRPVISPGELAPRRGGTAGHDRRGQADQGHRGGPAGAARGGRRRGGGGVRQAGRGRRRRATRRRCNRLRLLHQAIVDREEQGETLSRLLPGGLAEKLRDGRQRIGETETRGRDRADERHQVLLDDRRARRPEPAGRAAQHAPGGHEPCDPRRGGHGHAVRRRRGDGGLRRAVPAARPRRPGRGGRLGHARPAGRDQRRWAAEGLPAFGLGIGLSTGEVAAALLGSEERLEYTLVGDTVNLSQRLQQLAAAGETVLSEATCRAPDRARRTPSRSGPSW